MKELSIEQKAKAYDEALRIAKSMYQSNETEIGIKDHIASIFPELKESKDERIRGAIIDHLKDNNLTEWAAWLEKQGEKVEPIEGFNSEFERQVSRLIASTINKEYEYTEAFVKWTSDALLNYAKHELEKQGEQKLAVVDFNAKDWYVSKVDGKIHDMTYNPTDKVEPKFKVKYAGNEYNVLEVKDIAGVTFYGIEDEPNHIDYVKAENCEIIGGYAIKENGSAYPTKPAEWSEEDEFILEDAITAVDLMLTPKFQESNPNLYKSFEVAKHWLKSLKDRVQPKQEWSEEDESMLNNVIDTLKPLSQTTHSGYSINSMIDWLKSLRPQNRWKPSEEQIQALVYVFNHYIPNATDKIAWNALQTIELMLGQLLREE